MVDTPQKENGFTPIANEIMEALMKVNLSAYESRVLWFLFRKTYGWSKKTDWITLSQFSECIGLDRRLIHRAIKGLSSKKMIVIYKDDTYKIRYGFQKDYRKWKLSSKKMTVINRDDEVSSKEMIKVSSKEIPTKETITKDTIQKKTYSEDSNELLLAKYLVDNIYQRNPNHKKPDLQKWAKEINYLIRLDGKDPEIIRKVITWCQKDSFWQNNILSTKKLRDQFDQLFLKMKGDNNGRNNRAGPEAAGKEAGRAKSDGEPYAYDAEF